MNRQRLYWIKLAACLAVLAGCGSPSPAQLLQDAQTAVNAGDLPTASIHLRNLLAQNPDNAEARLLLGQVSNGLGDYSAAEQNLRRARNEGIDDPALDVGLLEALNGQGKFDQVVREFESRPASEGAARVAQLRLAAQAYQSLGELDQAEMLLREALGLNPGSEAARTQLAALVLADGRSDEATGLIAGVLATNDEYAPALLLQGQMQAQSGDQEAAAATFQSIIDATERDDQNYARAKMMLVEQQLALGNVDEAADNVDELLALNSQDPVSRYLLARVQRERGDITAAERTVERVVSDYPTFAPANQLLGLIKADQGQMGQAEQYLRAAVNNAPDNTQHRLLLAQIYLRQDKTEEARSVLSTLLPRTASDQVLYAIAGATTQRLGDAELAREFFEQSEDIGSLTPQEAFDLANFYATAGEFERAARVLEEADFGDAGAAPAQYLLAIIQSRLGDYAAAAETAEDIAASLPDEAWPKSLQGAVALAAQDYESARDYFSAARTLAPDDVQTLLNLARAELLLDNSTGAREVLRQAVALDPNQTVAIGALAELAVRAVDLDDARVWIAQMPDTPGRLRLEGLVAMAEGRLDEASDDFAALYEREPTRANAINAYRMASQAGRSQPHTPLRSWLDREPGDAAVQFMLGSYELQQGNLEAARESLESVIETDPNSAVALNNLAIVYDQMDDRRAIEMARRAYQASPENAAIADTLGWIHVGNGEAEQGLPYLEQAAAELPNIDEVQYHLAVALEETGDVEGAVMAYESALDGTTAFTGRDDAERRLANLRR